MLLGCLLLAVQEVLLVVWAGGNSCAIGPRVEQDPLGAVAPDAARAALDGGACAALDGGARAAALDS